MLPLLLACDDAAPEADDAFEVTAVVPADGAEDAVEAQQPELHLSAEADLKQCSADTIRLDGVLADGSVAFPVELTIEEGGDSSRLLLRHEGGLPRGWAYAITVQSGEDGCLDLDGRQIVPFQSTFVVP